MRLALVLALIASTALAEGRVYDRTCDVPSRRSSRGGVACGASPVSYAFFEFAPADGAGMGSACACTTPTGAKGEVVAFSRASTAWCTKGNETSAIADGDLVECASGQSRVMPGGDGTGGLGLSVWEARTNTNLRSNEFDNPAYTSSNTSGSDPTVTANYANGPDGTLTADRVQVASVATGQYSQRYQTSGCPGSGTFSLSRYFKGTSASGVVQMYSDGVCVQCAFNAATWTRCVLPGIASAGSGAPAVGLVSGVGGCASGALGAVDFLTWGGQCEAGTAVSPPITTTSAAATRVAELADVALTFGAGTTGFSTSATAVYPVGTSPNYGDSLYRALAGVPGTGAPGAAAGSVNGSYPYPTAGSLFTQDCSPSAPNTHTNGRQSVSGPLNRFATYFNPVGAQNLFGCVNGVCDSGVAAVWTAPTWTRYRLGNYTASSGSTNAVIKKICLDPSPTACL